MQFAGQRTDDNLNPVGEPLVRYIRLSDDVLPEPEAILLTGITPQVTLEKGVSEASFLEEFSLKVLEPDTTIVGFNNIRFDDEFMRFTLWRNLRDPYDWQWRDNRCKWDLLDVVRMTRALRPEGIMWPVTEDDTPVNKLTELTAANGLDHENAHDALSDVQATIDLAKLIKAKQPKLFEYLLSMCNKKTVSAMLDPKRTQPILHTSGMLGAEFLSTTAILPLFEDKKMSSKVVCWDLRYHPSDFRKLSIEDLRNRLFVTKEELGNNQRLPLKAVHTNRSPALAPIGVLDESASKNIRLTISQIQENVQALRSDKGLLSRLFDAWHANQPTSSEQDVDASLYNGSFLDDHDRAICNQIVLAKDQLGTPPNFHDARLGELSFRYKARNFPKALTEEEHVAWEKYRNDKFYQRGEVQKFGQALQQLSAELKDDASQSLLTDLQLYVESILPEPA